MPREPKIDATAKSRVLDYLNRGATMGMAAKAVGVSRQALYKAIRRSKTFKNQIEVAKAVADDMVESALYRSALNGDVQAQRFWLKNRRPLEWREAHVIDLNRVFDSDNVEFTATYSTGEPVPTASVPVSTGTDG